jgi:hypothetical protein
MPLDAPEDLPKEDPGQVMLVREDGAGDYTWAEVSSTRVIGRELAPAR